MNEIKGRWRWLLMLPALLAGTSCTTVVRENIISSVNTGIGVSLAENPKTEMYEAKVGYIRNQFYSVPTGKVVEESCSTNAPRNACGSQLSNRADLTPELVSGIRMNTDFRHLFLGATVSENFAVGKIAVMSPAAVAMYITRAENPQIAESAAKATIAVSGLSKLQPTADTAIIETMDGVLSFIEGLPPGDYPKKATVVENFQKVGDLAPSVWDFPRYLWVAQDEVLGIGPTNELIAASGYVRFKVYRETLRNSIAALVSIQALSKLDGVFIQDGFATNAVRHKIAAPEMFVIGEQAASQKAKLKELDRQFVEHPAVIEALDYFSSIIKK